MGQILTITLPIYALIAIGYAATRARLFSSDDMQVLGRFVIEIALPALLFLATASRDFSDILHPGYLVVTATAGLGVMALTYLWFALTGADITYRAAAVMGAACPNSILVGYPITLLAFPDQADLALALNTSVENLLLIPLSLVIFEFAKERGELPLLPKLGQVMKGVLRRRFMLGLMAGLVWSMSGLPLPAALTQTLSVLAASVGAVSLVVIGGTLSGLSLAGNRPAAMKTSFAKLFLHPALMALAILALPITGLTLSDDLAKVALLTAALPTFSIAAILAQDIGRQGMAALNLMLTTLGSFFTLTALLYWMT